MLSHSSFSNPKQSGCPFVCSAAEILADKLYWTFQVEKIGDLVRKGAGALLSCQITFDNQDFIYKFGKGRIKQISSLENHVPPRSGNSIFLPAKEVLSLHHIILKSREQDKVFGFDDTYLDLARAGNSKFGCHMHHIFNVLRNIA